MAAVICQLGAEQPCQILVGTKPWRCPEVDPGLAGRILHLIRPGNASELLREEEEGDEKEVWDNQLSLLPP